MVSVVVCPRWWRTIQLIAVPVDYRSDVTI